MSEVLTGAHIDLLGHGGWENRKYSTNGGAFNGDESHGRK